MRLDLREPARGAIQRLKVIDLAECLFNLKNCPGVEECIIQIRKEPLIESTLTELQIARMLFVKDYRFRFVKRTYVKGKDYDLEINLDNWLVCADVKCKLEETQISIGTITDTLRDGTRQLPPDKPGMLFVKVPQNWSLKYLHAQLMADAARAFFRRGRTRIVSVKFYLAPFEFRDGIVSQTHQFKEEANPNNKFDVRRSWELFTRRASTGKPPEMMMGPPRKWLRLVNFPDSIKDYEEEQ
jgi:hypothetical protein